MVKRSIARAKPLVFQRRKILLHPFRTVRMVKAILSDRRVVFWRKFFFLAISSALICVLVLPDLFSAAFLGTVLPVIGFFIGVPMGAGFDWATFVLCSKMMFRIFPEEVKMEHYRREFDRPPE